MIVAKRNAAVVGMIGLPVRRKLIITISMTITLFFAAPVNLSMGQGIANEWGNSSNPTNIRPFVLTKDALDRLARLAGNDKKKMRQLLEAMTRGDIQTFRDIVMSSPGNEDAKAILRGVRQPIPLTPSQQQMRDEIASRLNPGPSIRNQQPRLQLEESTASRQRREECYRRNNEAMTEAINTCNETSCFVGLGLLHETRMRACNERSLW